MTKITLLIWFWQWTSEDRCYNIVIVLFSFETDSSNQELVLYPINEWLQKCSYQGWIFSKVVRNLKFWHSPKSYPNFKLLLDPFDPPSRSFFFFSFRFNFSLLTNSLEPTCVVIFLGLQNLKGFIYVDCLRFFPTLVLYHLLDSLRLNSYKLRAIMSCTYLWSVLPCNVLLMLHCFLCLYIPLCLL